MPRIIQSGMAGAVIGRILPITQGGTNADDPIQALQNLSSVSIHDKNIPNGYLASNDNNTIDSKYIKVDDFYMPSISGPIITALGTISAHTITNYDSKKTYTLTAITGIVSRSGSIITYTAPAELPLDEVGFILNGKKFTLELVS